MNSAKLIVEENRPSKEDLAPVHFLYCSSMGPNKDSMFLYPRTKGQTEEALEKTGFEKVSICNPGLLKTVEPRPRFRLMESIGSAIFSPIHSMFGVGQIISVETVGKAMHRIAVDKSVKPTDAKNTDKKSVIGSLVSHFPNSDLQSIGSN